VIEKKQRQRSRETKSKKQRRQESREPRTNKGKSKKTKENRKTQQHAEKKNRSVVQSMPLPSSTLLLPPGMFFPTLHVFFVALLLFKCIIIHFNSNQVRHA
jgi:hypothetical protein